MTVGDTGMCLRAVSELGKLNRELKLGGVDWLRLLCWEGVNGLWGRGSRLVFQGSHPFLETKNVRKNKTPSSSE